MFTQNVKIEIAAIIGWRQQWMQQWMTEILNVDQIHYQ